MDKVIIIKNNNLIMVSHNGKRLVIDKNNKLFNQLKDLDKEKIKNWYLNRK